MLKQYLTIFFVSMVPLIELRGAIPISQGFHLPLLQSYIICILGNMLPVPVIYLFARKVLEWGKDKPLIGKFFTFCLEKGEKGERNCRKRQDADCLLRYCSLWESRFREPEHGLAHWPPAYWIWILNPAYWLLCSAYYLPASSWVWSVSVFSALCNERTPYIMAPAIATKMEMNCDVESVPTLPRSRSPRKNSIQNLYKEDTVKDKI